MSFHDKKINKAIKLLSDEQHKVTVIALFWELAT